MTDNIQKLYEIAGVERIYSEFNNGKETIVDRVFSHYRQLELIKLLAHKAHNGLLINKHITDSGASMIFDNLGNESTLASSFISFEECLAKLVNNLWQDLTEEERKQIREILE